jgi:acetoin utilization deacetylase AcuC-like enzyme
MMKVFFHDDFYQVYTSDPAAAEGRMEAVVSAIKPIAEFVLAKPALEADILAVHPQKHMDYVRNIGLYNIASLAAGGAVQAAEQGMTEPSFALIRPPGHHASSNSCWGFCYFNNMAIAIEALKTRGKIRSAYILDIDLHYGDGNVNILGEKDEVTVYNVEADTRRTYMDEVKAEMAACRADIIGISAGFDNHIDDWGGLLATEDYFEIGQQVRDAALGNDSGCFAILEGGYNHDVLGQNARALIEGLSYK